MTRGRSYLQLTGTQPFNDVVIGCASLKYFQQNSATLPKPKSKAECESQRAEIVSSLRKIACVVPLYALLPMTFCRRAKHARLSPRACPTQLSELFAQSAPDRKNQRHRPRTGPSARATWNCGTASAQTVGKMAADIRATKASHMPAETQRHTTPNHRFATHAARTRSIYHLLSLQLFSAAPPIMIFCHVVHIPGLEGSCPSALPLCKSVRHER